MLRRHLVSLLAPLLAAALFSTHPGHASADVSAVLVLGDSISAGYGVPAGKGWVALLDASLAPRAVRVVNASISGETTEGGKARLPALLAEHRPSVVLIELGGNDGLRGFPLAVTRANLEQMISDASKAKASVLLAGMRLPPNYGARYTDGFHALYAELAKAHNAALIPFLLEGIAGNPANMQDDGIHPRTEVQPAILQQVLPALTPLLRP
jgi:acyl-CoA thioesterase-1